MSFVKFLVIIIGLSNSSLIATQEYVLPIFILAQIHNPNQNQIQQNINFQNIIKNRKKQERKNQKNMTAQQKESERQRTKNKIYNKPGKYVGKYNSHIYYSKKGKN